MQKTRAERLMENAEGMDAVVIANDGEPFLDSTFWYITEQSRTPSRAAPRSDSMSATSPTPPPNT